MSIFYFIGMIIAAILIALLLNMGKKLYLKESPQYGMIAPLILMSWVSVILIVWKLGPKLWKYYKTFLT